MKQNNINSVLFVGLILWSLSIIICFPTTVWASNDIELSQCQIALSESNEKEILNKCEDEANGKNAEIQFLFGKFHYDGKIVEGNYVKAKQWFEKAKDNGSVDAIAALGTLYYFGAGVGLSTVEAARYYKEAAGKNSGDGQMRYGVMLFLGQGGLKKNTEEAIEWYKRAGKKGNAAALLNLGYLYLSGTNVGKNLHKSYIYFSAASVAGRGDEINQYMRKLNEELEGISRIGMNKQASEYIDKYIKPNLPGSKEYKQRRIEEFTAK